MVNTLPDFSEVHGQHLLVALSGGADSVALLHLLAAARSKRSLQLTAAHLEHGIRGEASRADAAFCQALCATLGIPLRIESIDVPSLARVSGEGIETVARRVRYDFLRRVKLELGADWIVLAHHQNDQAETVLMHLLRGCGPDGIGGMSTFRDDLYRPLLNTPKIALISWLQAHKLTWREDATNAQADTPRNALRLYALPALEESYPSAVRALSRYAEAARCESDFLQRCTEKYLKESLEIGPYGRRILQPEQVDMAILRRAIRTLCGPDLNHDKLLEISQLCTRSRGKLEISGTLMAERTPTALYFLPKTCTLPDEMPLPYVGEATLPGLCKLSIRRCAPIAVRDNPLCQVLRRDALKGAVIRTRREGDRIRPLGCGDRLLSDYLTDRKIDRPLRDHLPLLAVGNRILWVIGFGISEDVRLHTECEEAVELTCSMHWFYDRILGGN